MDQSIIELDLNIQTWKGIYSNYIHLLIHDSSIALHIQGRIHFEQSINFQLKFNLFFFVISKRSF